MPAIISSLNGVQQSIEPRPITPALSDTPLQKFVQLVNRAEQGGNSGGIGGGAIAGIIFGVVAALALLGLLIYCTRRSTPLRGPIFPATPAPKTHYPVTQEVGYGLPQYTGPVQQAYFPGSVPQPPPAVHPIRSNTAYYAHNQAPGVRFGEVGVRRI